MIIFKVGNAEMRGGVDRTLARTKALKLTSNEGYGYCGIVAFGKPHDAIALTAEFEMLLEMVS